MSQLIGPDVLVVGAGPSGCVLAERCATQLNLKVLVMDRRSHIAGNCYDRRNSHGLLYHEYGPHYFRSSNPRLIDYLSQFTDWIPGNYVVKSQVGGKLYPIPINLETLELFFGKKLTPESAAELLEQTRLPISHPRNSEDFVLSKVGPQLFEAFYKHYTEKQWGRPARELEASVCGRLPIRLNRDDRYTDAKFQLTPQKGFTEIFKKMLDHPNIELRLNCEFSEVKDSLRPKLLTVYCGPLDEYFDHKLGKLPWRSLTFQHEMHDEEWRQPCVQINYPGREPFTRTVEYKHITGDRSSKTLVIREFPSATGEAYYPVPGSEGRELFQSYRKLSEKEAAEKNVLFLGRLARYKYINTDEAVEEALQAFEELRVSQMKVRCG